MTSVRLQFIAVFCAAIAVFGLEAARGQDDRQVIPSDDDTTRVAELWARPGQVRNPVAIAFDRFGNLYVAESDRAGNAVTDTRQLEHLRPTGVEEDLRLRTVEDRRALIQKWLDAGHFKPDYFTEKDDRVRLLRDSDGDGVADESIVFADGFNDAVDGIASGVLWYEGDVYFTNIPHLWRLRDTNNDGVADERESLSYGYGVRWCFYGHDLHGLTAGPDGRIYFSLGDRGYNVTNQEGETFFGPDRGAVFRCWPDGSELELFYDGLRNPQELAFDEYGNFFTGDNNCDSGDRARILLVVEGGDSGWRQNVQSLPSRGPWNREFIWNLRSQHDGLVRPAWTIPPIAHVGAGPSGFQYYPGTGETAAYDDTFFFVDFYGSGATVHNFRLESEGAWFTLSGRKDYYKGKTVTDVAWGYDGRLYLSDWGGGWSPNENGNIFTITNETLHASDDGRAAIDALQAMFLRGFTDRSIDELSDLLAHRDQRVRLEAQFELARRGDEAVAALSTIAENTGAPQLKRIHAIWGLGQLARTDDSNAASILACLHDDDAQVRVQATKTVADLRIVAPTEYRTLLNDANAQVRFYAALGLGKTNDPNATPLLLNMLAENDNADPIIRHGAIHALELLNRPEELVTTVEFMPPAAKLGAVVALRRMNHIGVTAFLRDADPMVAVEAVRAVYDLYMEDGLPAVARMIESVPDERRVEPLLRRAIEANVLLGTNECAMRLARFAADATIDPAWRQLALQRLDQWDQPLMREGVWGDLVELPGRNVEAARHAIVTNLPALADAASGHGELTSRVEALRARFALDLAPDVILTQLGESSRDERYRMVLLEQLQRKAPDRVPDGCVAVLNDDSDGIGALRMRARELLVAESPQLGIERVLATINDSAAPVEERQHGVTCLLDAGATTELESLAARLRDGSIDDAIALEVYDAAKSGSTDPLRAAVEAVEDSDDLVVGAPASLLVSGGDPLDGEGIFRHHEVAQCLRCHMINGRGGTAGPELSTVGSRLTQREIVASLLDPNAEVAPGYGAVSVATTDRGTIMGMMLASSPHGMVIDVNGTYEAIPASSITAQNGPVSAMPTMASLLTPYEVRDVAAYLTSLQDPSFGPATEERRMLVEMPEQAEMMLSNLAQIMPSASDDSMTEDTGAAMRWLSLLVFFVMLFACVLIWATGCFDKEAL